MSSLVNVAVHQSQFPEQVRHDLLTSLRTRQINHKFHYDSVKQTQKWLALHQIYSPTRNNAACQSVYANSFAASAARIHASAITLIGLGCGGGQKDTLLLKQLTAAGRCATYVPCDVAIAMVIVARAAALAAIPTDRCFPLVFDLASIDDLPSVLSQSKIPAGPRLLTFFGMIPNFEPGQILPKLASLVRPEDFLLFSANLAPGADYYAGVRSILPQYDNAPTREWLLTFLWDLGVERADGELRFEIETDAATGLQRVVGNFYFSRPCRIDIESESFAFAAGAVIRLFFSYRYTPTRVRTFLENQGLTVLEQWVIPSGEEGIFLCQWSPVPPVPA